MQEEISSKTVSLIIETGKLTTHVLQKAIRESYHLSKNIKEHTPKGKQSLSKLKAQGVTLSNVEITKANIKSFDTVAKKFHIDYALMKQEGSNRYYVFFKGADAEVLEAAFREYAKKEFHLEEKGSLRETLDAVEEKRSIRIQERKQNRKKKKVRTKSEVKVPELRR
ncbi:MAG: PcfB family protein [Lachnospiraceae bacterium]|nr:PcfB family protein [Lachnospiraceae bacterium]